MASGFPYDRLLVIGATGSGKATLARRLAEKFALEYIELDALNWEPGWVEAPDAVFRERVERATRAPRWVGDGNYGKVRDILWPRAEALVWLDYPFLTVLGRLLRRILERSWTQEELPGPPRQGGLERQPREPADPPQTLVRRIARALAGQDPRPIPPNLPGVVHPPRVPAPRRAAFQDPEHDRGLVERKCKTTVK